MLYARLQSASQAGPGLHAQALVAKALRPSLATRSVYSPGAPGAQCRGREYARPGGVVAVYLDPADAACCKVTRRPADEIQDDHSFRSRPVAN